MLKKLLIGLVVLCVGGYVAYKLAYPTYTHRFRVTIAVDVNGKTHLGSSVMQTSGGQQIKIGDVGAWTDFKGDAIFVDLGEKGHVVAVLGLDDNARGPIEYWAIKAFGDPKCSTPFCRFRLMNQWVGQRRALPPSLIPMLVTFKDVNDPRSVQRVPLHNFESVFGPGVKIRGAALELTNDSVTQGIEEKLPWLKNYKGGRIGGDPRRNPATPERNLIGRHFSRNQ